MARRSVDWNEGLAQDLRKPGFAREFLLASVDEGLPLQMALGKIVRAYGVKEYAAKTKIAAPNLVRALNPKSNPTQETLNRLLKPLRLELAVRPIAGRRKAA